MTSTLAFIFFKELKKKIKTRCVSLFLKTPFIGIQMTSMTSQPQLLHLETSMNREKRGKLQIQIRFILC